jgi:teichuronic acid biosynthesis glycosyltransferase TuaH
MIKGKFIVVVGLQPWDIKIGSNCKNIAIELSKYNQVLYVNPPLDRITYLKSKGDELVQRGIYIHLLLLNLLIGLDQVLFLEC